MTRLSALWRINLLVGLFFALVALVCLAVLLRQANQDVQRELHAAHAVVDYLREAALRDPASLDRGLTGGLRHVRVHWLEALPPAEHRPLDTWLAGWLYPDNAPAEVLTLADGRRVQLSVDPRDEIDEVWDSLVQLLVLFGLALGVSLLTIRWAVRRGLRVVDELQRGFGEVARGQLQVRLPVHSLPEARQLAGHFNHMVDALECARAENAELTRALLALQERERRQLAQALHDDIGQYLAGIRAQLYLLRNLADRPQALGETVARLEGNCQGLQDSFRALIRDLYPVVLERLELGEAIRLLAEQWQGAQGIACALHLDEDLPALSDANKAHLYRLLQEALTNVARHADASQVRVRLRRRGRHLHLLVRDNGLGSPQPPRPGIGLRSMGERARSLGGELCIRTRPGAGLALSVRVPLVA